MSSSPLQRNFCFLFLSATIILPIVSADKYESWYYWYDRPAEPTLSTLETGTCAGNFTGYRSAVANGTWNGNGPLQWCYFVEDCMLSNMRPSFIANYQTAAVVLGILPTLLATLGPRIAEISLLSTTRPFLSFLISVGAPAVWPTRVFEYDDPSSSLGKGVNRRVLQRQKTLKAVALSTMEYLLVFGSIVNILQVAIVLGKQTVLSWSCLFSWAPLIWGLIPVFIHFLAAASYHFEVRAAEVKEHDRRNSELAMPDPETMVPATTGLSENPLLTRRTTFISERRAMPWWVREFTICANQPRGLATLLKDRKLPWFAVFFNCIASLTAFFHLIFGTMIFSSLIFISVYDILNFVFWRYILSTVICRLVLLIELMGMREEDKKDVEKVADAVAEFKERLDKVEMTASPKSSPRPGVTFVGLEEFEMKNRKPVASST